MDESRLINGVLRSVMGGRRRRSRRALRYLGGSLWSNPSVLLTAAGVAWGLFETLQQRDSPSAPASAPQAPAGTPLPPLPVSAPPVTDQALQIVRLAISAAYADGAVSEEERAAILEHARRAGVEAVVEQELAQPRPLPDVVAGVQDETQRAALYVLAFGILRGDEQPSGAERIYLAKLADLLKLNPKTVTQLEETAERGIDAQPEQ